MKQKLDPKDEEIKHAVARVTASEELSGASRLKSLLEYIADQYLEGRGDQILGKTIGMDVYGREPTANGDVESIVRVDASRLRRRLRDYYAGSGSADPILISVPKGGYVPVFERRPGIAPSTRTGSLTGMARGFFSLNGLAFLLVSLVALFLLIEWIGRPQPDPVSVVEPSRELVTLLELSPAAVQARDLAKDGQVLVFPASEADRVKTALTAFENAIDLDPKYYGGFAGASQALAILAGLAATPAEAQQQLMQAKKMAETAFLLNPDSAWSLSAMGWISFLNRDFDAALQLSGDAKTISVDDPYIHGFDMIISFFSGDFERALESSSPHIHRDHPESQFPWRIAQANSLFHIGEFDRAIEMHGEGIARGEPPGEISMAHMIASHQAAGRTEKARVLADAYARTWPQSRLSRILPRLFRNEEDAIAVLSLMSDAGWVDPVQAATPRDGGDK